ncbi:MAG: YraN family protein [Bacteroidetes bacterium]|nr:YraN family protein [Bacteroidota bacterium]
MKDRQELAREGEELAARYLADAGWTILERNYRYGRGGEIDIIARDGDYTVFIEVKTRQSLACGAPEYAITPSKQRQVIRIARGYMWLEGRGELICRFDVIAVSVIRGVPHINHIRNAFTSTS